jgi:molecular chaperone HtpG
MHPSAFGGYALDDPILARTVRAVCVGHGVSPIELEDDEEYPERRSIRGDVVNVRFLALLLRLGDLLDISSDRACPLLLEANSPLPPESYAHWSQYQRVTHYLVAPDRIELTAACETQAEHRFLADWCSWLVSELRLATWLMSRADRHSDWRPPRAELVGAARTIKIQPATTAHYLPVEWRLTLDEAEVFKRLIQDAYDEPLRFVRELIQNAADASRCRIYRDLESAGLPLPDCPDLAPQDRLSDYPVSVTLAEVDVPNEMTGTTERRQTITVEDSGIGMDAPIVTRFLRQVGRSYYMSEGFRRAYSFQPASQFGIGCLSVLAVSDQVTITTRSVDASDSGLRLQLGGFRNYLLTERGDRSNPGTSVQVELRDDIDGSELTSAVRQWCRRLEFPVVVRTPAGDSVITSERAEDFAVELPDVLNPKATLAVRTFPVTTPLLRGDLFVSAYVDDRGEAWSRLRWMLWDYPDLAPDAAVPELPNDLICIQGLQAEGARGHSGTQGRAYRVDVRRPIPGITLARDLTQRLTETVETSLAPRWVEILREHLNSSPLAYPPDGWKYIQRLMDEFDNVRDFWLDVPNGVRVWRDHEWRLQSVSSLHASGAVVTARRVESMVDRFERRRNARANRSAEPSWIDAAPSLGPNEMEALATSTKKTLFSKRHVAAVRRLASEHIAATWTSQTAPGLQGTRGTGPLMDVVEMPNSDLVGVPLENVGDSIVYMRYILNGEHGFVKWFSRVVEACVKGEHGLEAEQGERLYKMVADAVGYSGLHLNELNRYVDGWRRLDLPADLIPPQDPLEVGSFSSERFVDGLPMR